MVKGSGGTAALLGSTDRAGEVAADTSHSTKRLAVVAPAEAEPRIAGGYLRWASRYVRRLALADAVVGAAAIVLASFVPLSIGSTTGDRILLGLVGAPLWLAAVAWARGYERAKIGVGSDELRAVFRAGITLIVLTALPCAFLDKQRTISTVFIACSLAAVTSTGVRFVARRRLHRQQREGRHVRQVIVVGSAYAAVDLAGALEQDPSAGMQVVGACVPAAERARTEAIGVRVLGDLEQVPELASRHGVDAVAVTTGEATRHNYLRELTWALEGAGVELLVHPGLIEVAGPRMHIRPYVGLPLLHVEQPHFTGWRRTVKRATDLALSSFGLLVTSPVFLFTAAAIKLGDSGPVFFRQTRVGIDGSTFTMLKFRTMHVDAEDRLAELREQNPHIGVLFKMADDPRITRVGKFLRKYSLDELPQLLNIVAGSMSLVGPRPPLPAEVDTYEDAARRRLLVTPGLTGLWQVSGRSLLSWEESVRLDLRYVENWTFVLDLLIIWKTFFAVMAKRGAF